MVDVFQFQRILGRRLLMWSVPSIACGALLVTLPLPLANGIGVQAIIWGSIDAALAVISLRRAVTGSRQYPNETKAISDALRLRRILVVNSYLDLLYIAVGVSLPLIFGGDAFLLGNGIGVVIQGVFLFFFDLLHARRLPATPPPWYDPAP